MGHAILASRTHLQAQAPGLLFPKLFWMLFCHALHSPEAVAHFCWFGVSLQVSNCIATGIVPKNFFWLGKRKHVSMTTYLHDLRGYRSSRFPIANCTKSPFLEDDGGRIQHLYIPSFDPCSYGYKLISKKQSHSKIGVRKTASSATWIPFFILWVPKK